MATIPSKYSQQSSQGTEDRPKSGLKDWRQYLRAPRELSLTRPGKFFLLLTLAVGFGAINTGNNLLFLLLGMMLSLIIASGLLSEAVIRNIRIRRRLPRYIEAGRQAPAAFQIVNRGFWPALSIEIAEQNPRASSGPSKGVPLGPEKIPWWKFWRSQAQDAPRQLGATYCLRAPGKEQMLLKAHYFLPTRGRFELPGVQVSTRFPFGFFEKSRLFDAPAHLIVFPSPLPAPDWLGQLDAHHGEARRNKRGPGEDFFGLRDYRPGEDQRSIHWKSTARRGAPVVRETEMRERRAIAIILDNRAPSDHLSPSTEAHLERGLRHLAGLFQHLASRGYIVSLYSCDLRSPGEAPTELNQILHHLALIELRPASAAPPLAPNPEQQKDLTLISAGFGGVELSFDDLKGSTLRNFAQKEPL